jgi:hypothetical protein
VNTFLINHRQVDRAMVKPTDKDCKMSGKILIIDIVSTNRIVLRVKMLASKYDVEDFATGASSLLVRRPLLRLGPATSARLGPSHWAAASTTDHAQPQDRH